MIGETLLGHSGSRDLWLDNILDTQYYGSVNTNVDAANYVINVQTH